MMNTFSLTSLIFSGFFALTSLTVSAEELVGRVVNPASAVIHSSSSSLAAVDIETTDNRVGHPIETMLEPQVETALTRTEEFHRSDFNETILIPIVSVLVIFGGGFYFVIALLRMRYKNKADRRLQRQEQIQKFIDAGRDVPNELLRDVDSQMEEEANLAKGVKDTLIGLAIVVFLTVLVGFKIGAAGLIIVAAGLSRMIIWKISQSKKSVN